MAIMEGSTYKVLETKHGYSKGDKFIVLQHDLTDATYWVAVNDFAPHWEDADTIESLKLYEVYKDNF